MGEKEFEHPMLKAPVEQKCEWTADDDGNYETECGQSWTFTEGGLKENKISFCPYCGRIIKNNGSQGERRPSMSDLNHTPGPWLSKKEIDMVCWNDRHESSPFPTAYIQGVNDANICYVDIDTDEYEENVNLITAAPEMLSALRAIADLIEEPPETNCSCHINPPCSDCEEYGGAREAWCLIKSAIAKATGKENP